MRYFAHRYNSYILVPKSHLKC